MENLIHITLVTLMLIITHGQLSGRWRNGQVAAQHEMVLANGQVDLPNGHKKSISLPFSMVPDSTFNSNILVRPRLLFARTRDVDRQSAAAGDFFDELESKTHEVYSPILEEERENGESVVSGEDTQMINRRADDRHQHHHHHRPSVNRMKRHRLVYTSKGNRNRRRQSTDEEDDEEEITQPSEIDEVDQVEENGSLIRAKHRSDVRRNQGKYKSPVKGIARRRRARAYKRMPSKIDENDDESIEHAERESYDGDERAESTTLKGNEETFLSERITPLPLRQMTTESPLIPNLLSKAYETYSPDSTSAISGFVTRLREELHGKGKVPVKADEERKSGHNNASKMQWIPLPSVEDVDYTNDHHLSHQQSDRVKNGAFATRANSYKINSRPFERERERDDLTAGDQVDAHSSHKRVTSDSHESNRLKASQEARSTNAIESSASPNISSSASSFNPIAVQHGNHHLPHLMNDRITERLYSRGLLVYLKDFKYGGL